jgi:hypothetical protein
MACIGRGSQGRGGEMLSAVDAGFTISGWKIIQGLGIVLVPAVGWLARRLLQMHDRVIKLELQMGQHLVVEDEVTRARAADRERLVVVESAILSLTKTQERQDSALSDISSKLEILPRIDESLKYLARVCATIVPRDEWEMNNRRLDERISGLDK